MVGKGTHEELGIAKISGNSEEVTLCDVPHYPNTWNRLEN